MPSSPAHAIAHVFLPNLLRTKGAQTILGVVERKTDMHYKKYFLLEYDYVLSTKSDRTMITEQPRREALRGTADHG